MFSVSIKTRLNYCLLTVLSSASTTKLAPTYLPLYDIRDWMLHPATSLPPHVNTLKRSQGGGIMLESDTALTGQPCPGLLLLWCASDFGEKGYSMQTETDNPFPSHVLSHTSQISTRHDQSRSEASFLTAWWWWTGPIGERTREPIIAFCPIFLTIASPLLLSNCTLSTESSTCLEYY